MKPHRPRKREGASSGKIPIAGSQPSAGKGRPRGAGRPHRPGSPSTTATTDWSGVAEWYDRLVGDEGSDYHRKVVFPGVVRMLQAQPGDRVLDVACGQGALCRLLEGKGAAVTGIDAATPLIDAARQRGPASIAYTVGDARELERVMPSDAAGTFASAACVLAIQNIHPIAPVFTGVSRLLRPMGRFVLAMMHPCFRGPEGNLLGVGWPGGRAVPPSRSIPDPAQDADRRPSRQRA